MVNSFTLLCVFMISNGIVFGPPSEVIFFDAYRISESNSVFRFFVLTLFNSLGHVILFWIARNPSSVPILRSLFKIKLCNRFWDRMERYSNEYFELYGNKYLTVLFGRCVPGVHTGISIAAGMSPIGFKRFVIYTITGNLLFAAIIHTICELTPSDGSYLENLTSFMLVVGGFYLIHFIDFYLRKRKYKNKAAIQEGE